MSIQREMWPTLVAWNALAVTTYGACRKPNAALRGLLICGQLVGNPGPEGPCTSQVGERYLVISEASLPGIRWAR